jgi:hypothetical protein
MELDKRDLLFDEDEEENEKGTSRKTNMRDSMGKFEGKDKKIQEVKMGGKGGYKGGDSERATPVELTLKMS